MAPHSSTLAWQIPWMEEPGRLQSMGSLRVGHNWATSLSLFTFMYWRRKWQPTPVLAWRIPGMAEPGGLPSMGSHRVGHSWSDLAAAAAKKYFSWGTAPRDSDATDLGNDLNIGILYSSSDNSKVQPRVRNNILEYYFLQTGLSYSSLFSPPWPSTEWIP